MRTTLFSILFLWSALQINAQCCPYINSVQVLPSNPSTTDTVRVVMNVTTPSQGSFLGANHSITGNQINLQACYYAGMLPALQTYIDTVVIGVLPSGTYSLNFTARQSIDHLVCSPMDSTQLNQSFTVSGGTQPTPPPCCLQILNLDLLPSQSVFYPTHIYIRPEVQLPAAGVLHSETIQIIGNTVYIEACYLTDSVSNIQNRLDTLSIGLLTEGVYTISYTAKQGLNTQANCAAPISADTSFVLLEVYPSVSTNEFKAVSVQVYPNPVETWFTIQDYTGAFEIYDILGNLVLRSEVSVPNQRIDISNLSSGIYLLNFSGQVNKIKKL